MSILSVAVAFAAAWVAFRPTSTGWQSFCGQLAGGEAVLLMSVALVLISVLPAVETWFDGIDKAAVWHRRLAVIGLLLLVPHILFASGPRPQDPLSQVGQAPGGPGVDGNGAGGPLAQVGAWGLVALALWALLPRWRALLPRRARQLVPVIERVRDSSVGQRVRVVCRAVFGGYERWRSLHRFTGLLLAAGFVHGLLDATLFGSAVLRWSYLVTGGIGLASYVYRETVARFFLPLHDYQVASVTPIAVGLTELALTPLGKPLHFVPGQFAMLFLEGRNGWRRHPFTLSGAAGDGNLRFSIKALGDDTRALQTMLAPGMPAVVGGPHGRFDYARGTGRQIWIAGGIGVTPFLSWLRSVDRHPLGAQIDFFYSTEGPAPYAEELVTIAAGLPTVNLHLHDSATSGYLTPDGVLTAIAADDTTRVSVFLCGPAVMVDTFSRRLRAAGIPARHLHREHFDWR